MILKDYLQDKVLIGLEKYNDIILNVFTDKEMIGLDVDTTTIPGFSKLTYTEDFVIEGDIIKLGDLELDTNIVNVLVEEEKEN
jgi:hypothetical protein